MRGRPVKSEIRQNIVNILSVLKKAYGYEIHKAYIDIFPGASQRVIYYHLKKGVDTKEFEIERVSQEKGQYSWGGMAEKVYYKLGTNAVPDLKIERVKKYFREKQKKFSNI
jgi:hypothetical protein